MARRRSRSRRRGPRSRWYALASAGVVLVIVLFGTGLPGAAFSTGALDRTGSADVVGDDTGTMALNVTSELQEGTSGQCLVKVTNNAGTDVTVKVSLRDDSTHLGTLQQSTDLLGLETDNAVKFDLAAGNTKTVSMNTDSNTAGNTTYFHVNATSGNDFTANLTDRSAPIVQSGNTTCA